MPVESTDEQNVIRLTVPGRPSVLRRAGRDWVVNHLRVGQFDAVMLARGMKDLLRHPRHDGGVEDARQFDSVPRVEMLVLRHTQGGAVQEPRAVEPHDHGNWDPGDYPAGKADRLL